MGDGEGKEGKGRERKREPKERNNRAQAGLDALYLFRSEKESKREGRIPG